MRVSEKHRTMAPNTPPTDTARLLRLATTASVVTAALLIGAKLAAWLLSGSVSVLASLVDSAMDVAASALNLLAVRYSLMPADSEHRFGHGKAESLAGLAQATFIAGSAAFLVLHAVERLLNPHPLSDVGVALAVMTFSIAATAVLLGIQRYVIRRTQSSAIRADSLHYLSDLLTNASIIVALLLASRGWSGLDPLFGMGIAVYILYSAWHIGHDAFQTLMDRELPETDQQRIRDCALAHSEVRGLHSLRTRQSGQTRIIQLHLELDDHLSFLDAHRIADEVEQELHALFPSTDVIIHQDPASSVGRPQQARA